MKVVRIVPTLHATGVGEIKKKPDVARFLFSIETKGKTADEAATLNATSANKLVDALCSVGIIDDDIVVGGTQMYTRTEEASDESTNEESTGKGKKTKKKTVVVHVANTPATSTVRNLKAIGKVIDAVVKAGNYNYNGPHYDLDSRNRRHLEDEALQKAVTDAFDKAGVAAKKAGEELGRVNDIIVGESGGGGMPVPYSMMRRGMVQAASAEDMPVMPGEITVPATVTIEFLLRRKASPLSFY